MDMSREIDSMTGAPEFKGATGADLVAMRAGQVAGTHAAELTDSDVSLNQVVNQACEVDERSSQELVSTDAFVLAATIAAYKVRKAAR